MKKILIGSKYFFSCYPDFVGNDVDEIQLVNTNEFTQMRQITGRGKCVFQMKRHKRKRDYIDWAVKCKMGMVIGKFLVPEFCKEIGMNIADLPKLAVLLERLDAKHQYEKIIYDSYIENGSFTLTDEQRDRAYQSYKDCRSE